MVQVVNLFELAKKGGVTLADIGIAMTVDGSPKIMDLGDSQIKFLAPGGEEIIAIDVTPSVSVAKEDKIKNKTTLPTLIKIANSYANDADTSVPSRAKSFDTRSQDETNIIDYKQSLGLEKKPVVAQYGSRYKGDANKNKRDTSMFFNSLKKTGFSMVEENGPNDCVTRFNAGLSFLPSAERGMFICVGGPLGKVKGWTGPLKQALESKNFDTFDIRFNCADGNETGVFGPLSKFTPKMYRYIGLLRYLQANGKLDNSVCVLLGPTGSNSTIVVINKDATAVGYDWDKDKTEPVYNSSTVALERLNEVHDSQLREINVSLS